MFKEDGPYLAEKMSTIWKQIHRIMKPEGVFLGSATPIGFVYDNFKPLYEIGDLGLSFAIKKKSEGVTANFEIIHEPAEETVKTYELLNNTFGPRKMELFRGTNYETDTDLRHIYSAKLNNNSELKLLGVVSLYYDWTPSEEYYLLFLRDGQVIGYGG
ncbi:MAG: hypothetical protein WC417_06930, partial [Candidatus Omnitrophota bacterium]